jgi:hypothetical protein
VLRFKFDLSHGVALSSKVLFDQVQARIGA